MGKIRYTVGLGFISAFLLVFATQAGELDEKQEAQLHFKAGTRLFEVEDFDGAVTEFEASVRIYPTKNGYFNLANCYKALHRYSEALDAVEKLEEAFGEKLDRTMLGKIEDLKRLIASLVGELNLEVDPVEASVLLDGRPLSERGRRNILLGPGEHRLEIRAPGYKSSVQQVTIHSQKERVVRVSLKPVNGTLVLRTDLVGATVLLDGNLVGVTPLDPFAVRAGQHLLEISQDGYNPQRRTVQVAADSWTSLEIQLNSQEADNASAVYETDRKQKKPLVPLKITSAALSGVSAFLTGVFYGLAAAKASDFQHYDDAYVNATNSEDMIAADIDRLEAKDKTESFEAAGAAFAVCTGVFGVATIVFFVLDKKSERNTDAISLEGGRLTARF